MEKLKDRPGGLKVLIVEDSTLFRQLLSQALNGRFPSIKVYEAIDGEGALQKVEALTPDVIFMDLKSSGDNVLDLTKRIRARAPDAAVITLTAYELQQYADLFFSKNSPTAENIFTLINSILSKCE